MTGKLLLLPVIILLLLVAQAPAQTLPTPDPGFSAYLRAYAGIDENQTGGHYADLPQDSIKTQNPTVALFKSMFVPGLGQIGNRNYIKAGVIIALETTLIGTYIHYYNKTRDREDAFLAAEGSTQARLFEEYQDARDQRNRFGWYTGVLIFLSMFDAYVDAHLAQFPRQQENVTINVTPTPTEYVHINFGYSF